MTEVTGTRYVNIIEDVLFTIRMIVRVFGLVCGGDCDQRRGPGVRFAFPCIGNIDNSCVLDTFRNEFMPLARGV